MVYRPCYSHLHQKGAHVVQKSSISYIVWRSTNIRNGYVTGAGHVCTARLRLLYAFCCKLFRFRFIIYMYMHHHLRKSTTLSYFWR